MLGINFAVAILLALLSISNANQGQKEDQDFNEVLASYIESAFWPAVKYGQVWAQSFETVSYKEYTKKNLVDMLENRMCLQNAIAGAGITAGAQATTLASLGMGLPAIFAGQISASLAASLCIQVSLVSAVATVKGYDVYEPRVQTMILLSLIGDFGTETLKDFFAKMGENAFKNFLKSGIGVHLKTVNRFMFNILGQKFITISGKSSLVTLTNWIPLVGPIVSFIADGYLCKLAASSFDYRIFEGTWAEQEKFMKWLENHKLEKVMDPLTKAGWDTVHICKITEEDLKGVERGYIMKFFEARKKDYKC